MLPKDFDLADQGADATDTRADDDACLLAVTLTDNEPCVGNGLLNRYHGKLHKAIQPSGLLVAKMFFRLKVLNLSGYLSG
jgi:hypothetical protein